jgi:ATP/maltotriose-dependent transcriptional regulator MalT
MFVHRLKLRPPQLSSKWIARPLLEKRVTAANVVGIVAGPGYGKTGLAARVYHAYAGPKIWYGLDRGDADLSVFAAHMQTAIAALGRGGDAASDTSWRTGSARETGSRFAEAIADFDALVVLDDVHVVEGSASAAALAEFVERAARAGTRLVLTGRALPLEVQAAAPRLALAIVGTSDLRFDDDQALQFFAADDARGSASRAALIGRAEGWPAGLTLIANAPASRAGVPHSASGDEARSMLFGYLATEALDNLSERERAFLLATGLPALPGWDYVTGLGSFDIYLQTKDLPTS